MWESDRARDVAGQGMVAGTGGIKNTELLIRQPMATDAIRMEDACMRSQTRQDR
jgi:hypothetical protein